MAAQVLYTSDVLGLATSLAGYPFDDGAPLKGEARSRSCGSTIALSLAIDAEGRIERAGVKSQACAIGEAAAAIFAAQAPGRSADDITAAREAIRAWLTDGGHLPDWPGLERIATAREYPARHGAILLAWNAASELLPTT